MGIYVWGTGCGASELVEQGLEPERITAFVDSFPAGKTFLEKPVLLPEELPAGDCELLIVTTRHTQAVAARCEELGIPAERVLFLKNNWTLCDRNDGCTAAKLLPAALLERLLPKQHIVPSPAGLLQPVLGADALDSDYVRLSTLELLCRRAAGIPGAAAELGVYRGFFAGCINRLLPDRELYLFDSFAGFPETAGAGAAFQAAHCNSGPRQVLAQMPHPERVILRPGFFPETARGLEDVGYALVSLDVDYEETTLEGLRYFWPRLHPGGYVLVHDWGNPKLPGVAAAVTRFEQELGTPIPAVPLCDIGGTLVLCK